MSPALSAMCGDFSLAGLGWAGLGWAGSGLWLSIIGCAVAVSYWLYCHYLSLARLWLSFIGWALVVFH